MDRKLASIQRIIDVQAHPNADTLEIARILGWNVVVRKGEFKPSDLCVYIEIDSVLPDEPDFQFLRTKNFRIKTIRLRGQISQGIAFPLYNSFERFREFSEGSDITELVGVVKYEPTIHSSLSGDAKGNFPSFLKKTDEIRIQSVPYILDRYKDARFYVTEKLDGSSMTVYVRDGEFGVCSRNLDLKESESNAFWRVANTLKLKEKMLAFGRNIAIQGELVGPNIQNNKYGLKSCEFRPFTAFDIDKYERLEAVQFLSLCSALDLKSVPILDFWFVLNHNVDQIVTYASGPSQLNPNAQREGIVVRPIVNKQDPDLGDLSFKVISPTFLLNNDE